MFRFQVDQRQAKERRRKREGERDKKRRRLKMKRNSKRRRRRMIRPIGSQIDCLRSLLNPNQGTFLHAHFRILKEQKSLQKRQE